MSPVAGFSSAFLAVLVPVALCGGFIRGFTGFGGPLFVLPVMAIFEPAEIAAASVLCMDVVANIQLLPAARSHWSARALLPLLVGTAVGLPFGTQVLVSFDPVVMRRVIVAVVLLAAATLLAGWRYRRPINLRGYGAIGLVGGAVMGATGLGVVTPLMLDAGSASADERRANIVAWVFLATVIMLTLLFARHVLPPAGMPILLPLVACYMVGIAIGARMHDRVSEGAARRGTLLCIILVAVLSLAV